MLESCKHGTLVNPAHRLGWETTQLQDFWKKVSSSSNGPIFVVRPNPNGVSPSNGFVDRPPPPVPPSHPQKCAKLFALRSCYWHILWLKTYYWLTCQMDHITDFFTFDPVLTLASCSPIPPSKVCKTIYTEIMLHVLEWSSCFGTISLPLLSHSSWVYLCLQFNMQLKSFMVL